MSGTAAGTVNFRLAEGFFQLRRLRLDLGLVSGHLILLCFELGEHRIDGDITRHCTRSLRATIFGDEPTACDGRAS